VSCWRGDQQSDQYDHAKHKWHLAQMPLRNAVANAEAAPEAATSHDSTHCSQEWNFCKLLLL